MGLLENNPLHVGRNYTTLVSNDYYFPITARPVVQFNKVALWNKIIKYVHFPVKELLRLKRRKRSHVMAAVQCPTEKDKSFGKAVMVIKWDRFNGKQTWFHTLL